MKATATTHTVNIKDVVTKSKVMRMDWNTGRLVEIQGYTLEVGQKVLYAEAYGARSWWVCVSEPGGVNGRLQNLVEIGGEHRAMTWDVNNHDQSTADIFGIGLYYDNSGERLTAEEIEKHVRASEIQSRWNDRREANQKKAEAAERAALRQQWAGILTPLEDVKDWREREKTEKANVINHLKNHFPGVKFTARKTSGGGSYCISWTDGPSVSAVEKVCNIWHDHTFNGYEDYNEYTPSQFNRLFGGVEYRIDTNRKNSPEAVQTAREALAALCPELAALIGTGKDYDLHGDGQKWLDMTVNRRDDDQARAFCEAGKHQAGHWYRICPDAVLRVYLEEQDRTQHTTTPTDPKPRKAQNIDTTTDTDEAPADGLQLVEIPGGVAVIGDSRTTYRNRKAIKTHGARWNRDAQQWQATDPEAVAALRAWFGVDDKPTPDPDGTAAPADNATTAADDTPTTATEAAESTQTAPAGNNTANAHESHTETAETATDDTDDTRPVMMKQFANLKEKHPDRLLLFRCGDFYELYERDAHTAADLLGIITTDRPDGVTMCAFPHHALDAYLPRIIRAGHRVAICDQLQDERITKRITKRGITPTTPTEAAQAPETATDDQQPTEAPKAQQSAQKTPESESDGGELFTLHGETFRRGDRVTIDTTTDGHTTTEAGTLTDYARGQELAEVTTDDGRKIYGFFDTVKHAPTDHTPGKGDGDRGGTKTAKENETPVIEPVKNDRICTAQDGISPNGIEVTNPIKAADLNTPQAYAYTLRRAIVTDCNDRQRAELVELLDGKDTAEGVTFNNTRVNRDRLHIWQNEQSRKERAAILGEGWQYIEGLNTGTEPGDVVACIDGTRGRVTKSSPESCCIEFETEGGQRLSVAGYFRKESPRYRGSENSQISEKRETGTTFADALEIREGDRVLSKHFQTTGTVTGIYEWNGGMCYDVTLDKAVRGLSGETITKTAFRRYGITKNYDPQGNTEIVGNAIYYAEELQAGFWGTDSTPRTIFDCEIFKPTDRRPSWLLVTDIFSSPKEATLDEVADYLAARYQEDHKPMLQDSEEIKADVFRNGLTEEQAGKLTAKLSQWARMTDENNHTEARVSIAKFFGLVFQDDFKKLQEKGYSRGYLTMNDRETSCRLTTRMLGAIERCYCKDIADRVRKCL